MSVINKSEVQKPTLPKETVPVPALNGDVVVSGLMLKDRLALFGGTEKHALVSFLLSVTVTDVNGDPLYTQEEWEIFGANHFNESLELFAVAKRLSGLSAEVSVKK